MSVLLPGVKGGAPQLATATSLLVLAVSGSARANAVVCAPFLKSAPIDPAVRHSHDTKAIVSIFISLTRRDRIQVLAMLALSQSRPSNSPSPDVAHVAWMYHLRFRSDCKPSLSVT